MSINELTSKAKLEMVKLNKQKNGLKLIKYKTLSNLYKLTK